MTSLLDLTLWIAGLTALAAIWLYARATAHSDDLAKGNRLVAAHVLSLTVASAALLYLFLSNQYQYQYVAHNSARDLPLFYKISAFWAGQEGTFLLWALITGVLALFMMRRGGPLQPVAMICLLVTQLFLVLLLVIRSPFAPVPAGVVLADGNGLNPLLKDPWMVIHPPIVFVGYAAFAVPFAYAVAALIRREWQSVGTVIFPWAAFATATLGLGIFIGGFWAYKVLGWGGYWGWDPVENASLVPWLTGLALAHSLLVFRAQGQLARTTFLLAIMSYVLIVYGTFLTRSGVLADFSVHSFTDVGINVYLTGYLIAVTAFSLGLLVFRARRLPAEPISKAVSSREFALVLSILLLTLTAGLVLVGTSSPILTGIGGTPSNVTSSYYNSVVLPLGIFIAFILGFSPFLLFERMPWNALFRAAAPSFLIAGAIAAAIIWWTPITIAHAVLVFAAVLAFVSNLKAVIRSGQWRLMRIAGHLTHLGFAVMAIGIIASSAYSSEERVNIASGGHASAFGYEIIFRGAAKSKQADEGYLDVLLAKGNDTCAAYPRIYTSEYTQQTMRTPYVRRGFLADLYVAPLDHRPAEADANVVVLTKGESVRYGDWNLRFERYEMGEHSQANSVRVGAVITVLRGADSVTVVTALETSAAGQIRQPTPVPGTKLTFTLAGISVEERQIALQIGDPNIPPAAQNGERVELAVTRKPLTSFVWTGCILITLGSALSFWRRRREAALMS